MAPVQACVRSEVQQHWLPGTQAWREQVLKKQSGWPLLRERKQRQSEVAWV